MKTSIFLIALLIFGCSNKNTVSFKFDAPEAKALAIEKIKNNNIWFKLKNDGSYEFNANDLNKIITIYAEVTNSIIPFGRSTHFGAKMQKRILKEFNSNGISYKLNQFQGVTWVVWPESESEKVEKIKKQLNNS